MTGTTLPKQAMAPCTEGCACLTSSRAGSSRRTCARRDAQGCVHAILAVSSSRTPHHNHDTCDARSTGAGPLPRPASACIRAQGAAPRHDATGLNRECRVSFHDPKQAITPRAKGRVCRTSQPLSCMLCNMTSSATAPLLTSARAGSSRPTCTTRDAHGCVHASSRRSACQCQRSCSTQSVS